MRYMPQPKARKLRIAGVDPGLSVTGYGVIDWIDENRPELVRYGVIRSPAKTPLSRRLYKLYESFCEVLSELTPDLVAVEDTFHHCNIKSAMKLGQARGVILLAAAGAGIKVIHYSPLQIKQSLVGYGRAEKDQVQFMVKRLLAINDKNVSSDASDALAAALCHAHSLKFRNMVEKQM